MKIILFLVGITSIIEGVVLDPALYLAPRPPLTTSSDNNPEKMWSESMVPRMKEKGSSALLISKNNQDKTTLKPESMEVSETFWPRFRTASLKEIYIPLSFHISGTYGGNSGSGVYSSGYMGMPDAYSSLGTAALAGTNYKSPGGYSGLRVFGGSKTPGWSGWGNGKWGHYGNG